MPKDRKHKKYVPRRVVVPLTKAGHDAKSLQLHAFVESAIHAASFATLDELAKRLGAITAAVFSTSGPLHGRRDSDANAIQTMHLTLEAVQARRDRLGEWSVSREEATSLRQSAGQLDSAIKKLPFNVMRNAEVLIEKLLKTMTPEQVAEMVTS